MFVDEMLAAYPDTKVVLTEREVDSWITSMTLSLYRVRSWRTFPLLAALEPGN